MEVDHIFICVSPGAPEAEALIAMGLAEGTPNTHPGQGTANRRFFFNNAFIEFLWLADATEAKSEISRPTRLFERLTALDDEISPFGICLRPGASGEKTSPFPVWRYKPPYLPGDLEVEIACDVTLNEPMWFFLSFAARPDLALPERKQVLQRQAGFNELTSIRITLPISENLSDAARVVVEEECVSVLQGTQHLLALGFDHETQGRTHDFRPALPLIFKW